MYSSRAIPATKGVKWHCIIYVIIRPCRSPVPGEQNSPPATDPCISRRALAERTNAYFFSIILSDYIVRYTRIYGLSTPCPFRAALCPLGPCTSRYISSWLMPNLAQNKIFDEERQ